ncbi:MAG: hypothetical protein QT05_C0047G0049 [archaeon GW2011_AR13]|nr:MAG: hypothetical protein QT05_C0047G0049 [archaeon GW2011_AR13]HIG94673.1 hypothetical protein [Nanoarchaeota archaeon]HIH63469.1 hypothetical protein [Nanoarchaeota archaeon]HIJ09399.1 hypothetical protein [Nanoarchaeota archaeon]HLD55602.1 hypothetical protein [Candidatus Nanoarchaeia archaeon]
MVKKVEHKEDRFYCEFPGCTFYSTNNPEEAQKHQAQGLIGPNLKPGLVLGGEGYKNTYINNKENKFGLDEGLPEIEIYILTGNSKPKGHNKVYLFHELNFRTPGGIFSSQEERKKYQHGIKHKWTFYETPISADELESKLTFSWVTNPIEDMKELAGEEFNKIKRFIETHPEAQEARDFLKAQNLEGQLKYNNSWVKKVLQKKWDDYYD